MTRCTKKRRRCPEFVSAASQGGADAQQQYAGRSRSEEYQRYVIGGDAQAPVRDRNGAGDHHPDQSDDDEQAAEFAKQSRVVV